MTEIEPVNGVATVANGPRDPAPDARLVAAILLPVFLATFDQTVVATALPAMSLTLGNIEAMPWIMVGYLMANTVAAPVYGRLGDTLGRRRMMFWSLALFVAATIGCALAARFEILLAGRVLQGLGAGGLMTLAQALVGESVPLRKRGVYQSYIATVALASNMLGPVAGGFLSLHLGWQSIFLITVPIALLAAVMLARMPQRVPAAEVEVKQRRLDILGIALFAGFVCGLSLSLSGLQTVMGGDTVLWLLPCSAATVVLLALLILRERGLPHAIVPLDLLGGGLMWRTYLMTVCHGAVVLSLITYLPILLSIGYDESLDIIGLSMVPLTFGIGVGSILTGRLMNRTGRTAIFPTIGLAVTSALFLLLAVLMPWLGPVTLPIVVCGLAIFLGSVMSVAQVTVQIGAGQERLGAAAGLLQCARAIGAAIGTALTGGVLLLTLGTIADGADLSSAAPGALIEAFRVVWIALAIVAAFAATLAATLPVRRL